MKKIIFLIALFSMTTFCFAEIKLTKAPAIPLEKWLQAQDKLDGAKVCTKQNDDGAYEVTEWEVAGVAKPTNGEIVQIIKDYEKQPKPKTKLEELEIRIEALEKK